MFKSVLRQALGVLFVLGSASMAVAQDLVFTPESSYHAATYSERYAEDWPEDKGGLLYLFVKNSGNTPQSIVSLSINGKAVAEFPDLHWWRAWPAEITPGAVGWVAIKATGAPLERDATAEVAITAASGAVAKTSVHCAASALHIGNVLPSEDRKILFVYLRNDGDAPVHLATLHLNAADYVIGQDAALQLLGAQDLAPGGLAILKVKRDMPWETLAPLVVRVAAERAGATEYVGAGMRLGDAHFSIGTWSSDLPGDLEAMATACDLAIDCVVTGHDWERNAAMASAYGIRTLSMVNKGDPKSPDTEMIAAQAANTTIAAWMVRDEPELGNKPSSLMLEHNQAFWQRDADTPTYLNLMMTRAFNDYGSIADIACMDHYVQFAPNAISWTGVTRNAVMEEAIAYTDLLKENTEPQRMWTWAQLAASVWGRQPEVWGVHYQFWAHIMGGAKGVLWFKYGPGWENKYTPQINAGRRIMQQFKPVRNLCFYGEPLRNLRSNHEKIIGRTLNSENAVVAVVLNNNQETGGLPIRMRFSIEHVAGEVVVPVPDWIPVEQVMRVTPDDAAPVAYRAVEGGVAIEVSLDEEMGVFIVGRKDSEAPSAAGTPQATVRTPDLLILSWSSATDNYGVRGYTLYRDGERMGEAFTTALVLRGGAAQAGRYSVEAFDAAKNPGPRSAEVVVE